MCQDPLKILDLGSEILTDPGSWVGNLSKDQWILGLVHTVFAGSCGYRILVRKIAAGSWRPWILIREKSLAHGSSAIRKTLLMDDVDLWSFL